LYWLRNGKKRRKSWGLSLTGCFTEWCIALQIGCTALHSGFITLHNETGYTRTIGQYSNHG
jgi:hypothetical protein